MKEIVGVGFLKSNKTYYFNPEGAKYKLGELVIVETSKGLEMGHISIENTEVEDDDITRPLKPIERRATDKDLEWHRKSAARRTEAMRICNEKITEHALAMKLVDAEFTVDDKKVIFYFSADERVDFRALVKDLAISFKMRIELRQIGSRDEAKRLGGIGMCGRAQCCNKWLGDFQPVSIKMAKQQNLSLNPSKISGNCGKLMCCLNFENRSYVELSKGMPKEGERIMTPDGLAEVIKVDIFSGEIVTRLINKDEETGEEILSQNTEIYFKKEIKRLKNKKNKGVDEKDRSDETEELDA